jgi:hypothetical protein
MMRKQHMATNRVYPTDLSPEEAMAGFRLVEIENPEGRYQGKPKKVWAVVFQVEPSYRLVKTLNPFRHYYNLQMFGVFHLSQQLTPEWHPIEFDGNNAAPGLAARAAAGWIAANPNKHYLVRVPEEEK